MESYTVKNFTFAYPSLAQKALDSLSFSVHQGEFITLIGPSGSGKSTLLRHFKTALAPHGSASGDILFEGRHLTEVEQREQSARIGFVLQNPDNQIVTDKVWHELAFGLESLGCDTPTIRCRVAEMASFFGIQTWFHKNVTELSGGQKQLLNLASIMAMQPSVLILDEPTSQLDPIAAADFLAALGKINRELGTTVILTEHRLEEVFPMSDRVLVMDHGKLLCEGTPRDVGRALKNIGHNMLLSLPAPMLIDAAVSNDGFCPVTVREGRQWLDRFSAEHPLQQIPVMTDDKKVIASAVPEVELVDVWFKYGKDLPDVVKGLSLKVSKGEFLAILGGNGTGKTTALSLISGINRPYRGNVILHGRKILKQKTNEPDGFLGVLPQNPQALFVKKTVREDLLQILDHKRIPKEIKDNRLFMAVKLCRLNDLLNRHPYDLSGGEQQRAALAKVLLLEPQILLLDEPTKGLDSEFKQMFGEILQNLLHQGITIIMVSHDIEFCAKYAHQCAMFFDGQVVTQGSPRTFFSGNSFYTTCANRMARHLLPEAVSADDVIAACGGKVPPKSQLPEDKGDSPHWDDCRFENIAREKLPLWRKLIAWTAGCVALIIAVLVLAEPDILWLMHHNHMGAYIALLVAAAVLLMAVSRKGKSVKVDKPKLTSIRKLPRRTLLVSAIVLLVIPITIYVGIFYLDDRKYYFISLLIILETMLPFFLIFEGRKPQARELIIISTLCAFGVAGRAAFFMLPEFKPVVALVIISGVAFGGEAGFLVGSVTMFVSNVLFGQGPWTPWQMFAMGIIGFLAGVMFGKERFRQSRVSLSIFGGFVTIMIYGGLMNAATVIMYYDQPTWPMFLSAYLLGFPFDLIHAFATVIFLWFISQPMLEKLDRIKVRYNLIQL